MKDRKLKPSDFSQIQPMNSVKQKSECETIAHNIMQILAISGDTWRVLPLDEYTEVRKSHGNWNSREDGFFNEVIGFCKSEDTARLFSPFWNNLR